MEKIMLAGSTGYLGSYILSELLKRNYSVKAVVRNKSKIKEEFLKNKNLEIFEAELTNPQTLKDCCKDVDVVISTVGITRQKDGLTYMDVDYQANVNLLREAEKFVDNGKSKKRFIYISVFNEEKIENTALCKAKEKFVKELKNSRLDYCVIRPTGFFSDISEIFKMAERGKVYLFGKGEYRMNPIHGEDLAEFCVNRIHSSEQEFPVGGPEIFTQKELSRVAFKISGKKEKIVYISDKIRVLILKIGKFLMPKTKFGPIEFFLNAMSIDMVAPEYGKHTIEEYFEELKNQ
ncbi:SDR family oxidoreductase [Pseudoleptotrichia goodfellowii]|uniref:NAD-dependent epimerase/dehydratase n=1 Tax=Pseudoleptotrichia goodfellowii TaxID=157692 RepID=A0A510JD86_9FUSO|nr:SDR family oxidoreductase [Pseudoleptotrichia goodfellowii]BBM37177.1 NAD-dependent epimerase/dehydratase [Pseudoleptotrichia goodfellowii]